MSDFPILENEKARLKALQGYQLLDSLSEIEFDRITELASLICDTPISLVSLLDEDRQWFKSKIGLDVKETAKGLAFCQHAIMDVDLFEVEDALLDPRFKKNALVTESPNIRFYAGFPLIDPDGYPLGTLCVIDSKPRKLTPNQKKSLQLLTDEVMQLIVERKQKNELKNFEKLFNLSKDLICIIKTDGFFKRINPAFEKVLGWDMEYLLNTPYMEHIHPDDVEKTIKEIEKVASGQDTLNFIHRFKTKANKYKTLAWSATPDQPFTGDLYAIARDVSEEDIREQLLIESEQKLRAFFENSLGLMSTHDLKENFLSRNNSFAESLGYTREEISKLKIFDLIPEEYHEHLGEYFSEIKTTGKSRGQMMMLHKNGSHRMLAYNNVLMTPPDGESYVISNAIDITERHYLETELHQTKEILEQTNTIARIGGWEFQVQEQQLHWTPVTKEIQGVPLDYEPNIEKDIVFFKEGESRNAVLANFDLAITEGKSSDLEVQIITTQGKEKWVRILTNAEMENRICKRLYGTFQDIDEKKKAALELDNARKILDDVLKAATEVSIIATDTEGIITVFNAGAEKLLGYTAAEMIGKHSPVVFHLETEITTRSAELTEELGYPVRGFSALVCRSAIEGSENRQWTYVKKDGALLTVQLVVTAIRDEQLGITGYLSIATNISDLKRAKSDLEIVAEHLKAKNKQLLNFAHITSHNLRAPVSNLNMLLTFYKESTSAEDKEILFEKFETVIGHLSDTLNELIEALKIQEDLDKKCEQLSFEKTFNKTKETLIAQIMETNAMVTADFSQAPQVNFPKSYLESILQNLFSNAIRYRSPKRSPEIHFQTFGNNQELILTVSDNGLGIDLKKHGHKLFGLNKTFHRHPDAKGVGLFIAKAQVEAMGGKISAESEIDKGTTFKIIFNNNRGHE